MQAAMIRTINPKTLHPELRQSLDRTRRFLRHTFRKVLAQDCQEEEVTEQLLRIDEPHIFATWSTQSCLLGAGLKIGLRLQFDSPDGRLLQTLQGHSTEQTTDEQLVKEMQEATDQMLAVLQRHCQAAGLITGISQASVSKAFSKVQRPSYQLRGGVTESWMLNIGDCVVYGTSHIIFDDSPDLILLAQGLPA